MNDGILYDRGYFICRCLLRGTFYRPDRAEIKRQVQLEDPVALVRETDNPHDTNAVAVCDVYGRHLGYIDRGENHEIAFLLDQGIECAGIVSAVNKSVTVVGIAIDVYAYGDEEVLRLARASFRKIIE